MNAAPYGILVVTGSHTHQENYAAGFAADSGARSMAVTDELGIDRRRLLAQRTAGRALGVPYVPDLVKVAAKDVHVVSICAPPERRAASR